MNARRPFPVPLLAGLLLAAPACQKAKQAAEAPVLKGETRRTACGITFQELSEGGRMYAGTVESVTVAEREPGLGEVLESGEVAVRVRRAVRGPAVKSLRLAYSFSETDPEAGRSPVTGDFALPGPWRARPRPGAPVLLLLTLNPSRRAQGDWERDTEVGHVWVGVGPDHPLVKDFEVAVRYLETRDPDERRGCFGRLCGSAWQSVRNFAQDAAFARACNLTPGAGAGKEDWPGRCRLMLRYMKSAGPALTGWERPDLTRALRFALCNDGPFPAWLSGHPEGAAAEWLAAFEKWYLTELGADTARPTPERSEQVLIELRTLVHRRGVAGTVALFQKRGRAGLDERLQACAESSDPFVATNARELSDMFRAERKVAAGMIASREGDAVSLQTVIPDVLLHVGSTYTAENLPPGATIDRGTGVISGRLAVGAGRKSPYKVRISRRSKTRFNPDQQTGTEFSWLVGARD